MPSLPYQKPELKTLGTLGRALNDPHFRELLEAKARLDAIIHKDEPKPKIQWKPTRPYRSHAHGWRRQHIGAL